MVNLKILEELRTKEEIFSYFKQLGKNITEKEINDLKKNYDQTQKNKDFLAIQQLDDVVGGIIGFKKIGKKLIPIDANIEGVIADYTKIPIFNEECNKILSLHSFKEFYLSDLRSLYKYEVKLNASVESEVASLIKEINAKDNLDSYTNVQQDKLSDLSDKLSDLYEYINAIFPEIKYREIKQEFAFHFSICSLCLGIIGSIGTAAFINSKNKK